MTHPGSRQAQPDLAPHSAFRSQPTCSVPDGSRPPPVSYEPPRPTNTNENPERQDYQSRQINNMVGLPKTNAAILPYLTGCCFETTLIVAHAVHQELNSASLDKHYAP